MEYIILFLPLFSSIISGIFGRYFKGNASGIVTSFLVSISAVLSIIILFNVVTQDYSNNLILAT